MCVSVPDVCVTVPGVLSVYVYSAPVTPPGVLPLSVCGYSVPVAPMRATVVQCLRVCAPYLSPSGVPHVTNDSKGVRSRDGRVARRA